MWNNYFLVKKLMSPRLTVQELLELSVKERKALIQDVALSIDVSRIADTSLHDAYRLGKTIAQIAESYFQYQIEQCDHNNSALTTERQSESINQITHKFATNFIEWLKQDFEKKKLILENHPNPSNLFELCGAKLLVTSNSVTRSLSTRMGRLWEDISNISPYVMIPEYEFGIKITGIDIVIYSESLVYFAQLKTLKGTLTGSQVNRAKKELGIHDNSLFISAFNLGSWTFPADPQIARIAGEEFWRKIKIDYDLVENSVREMLLRIDKTFAELAAANNEN